MEIANIHIQVSVNAEEVACREDDFTILSQVTQYCLAWKSDVLEEKDLEAQLVYVIRTYREHNQLANNVPLLVGVWFETPIPEPQIEWKEWEPVLNTQPDLRVIQGGKDD